MTAVVDRRHLDPFAPPPSSSPPAAPRPAETPNQAADFRGLVQMKRAAMEELANRYGIPTEGTRAALLARLQTVRDGIS